MILGHPNSFIQDIAVMSPFFKVCMILCAAILLTSCASDPKKEALQKTDYTSDRNGISLKIAAPVKLNLVGNSPHTLAMAVVQLNTPKAALALSKNSAELDKLLSGISPADSAILAVDRYVIQPSAMDTLTIGRVEDAQVILIYVGYFNALLEKRVRLYKVPVKIASQGWFGWLTRSYSGTPLPLNLSLNLGETAILDLSLANPHASDSSDTSSNKDNPTLNGAEPPKNSLPSKVMDL